MSESDASKKVAVKARELATKHKGDEDAAVRELVEWMEKQEGGFRRTYAKFILEKAQRLGVLVECGDGRSRLDEVRLAEMRGTDEDLEVLLLALGLRQPS